MKNKTLTDEARSLLCIISTYADFALEQLDQGAIVTVETFQEIQQAKEQTGVALVLLSHDNKDSSHDV